MTLVERVCWCGKKFMARPADVRRGWAKACCKSHAAHVREKRLDRHGYRLSENGSAQDLDAGDWEGSGWDAHKDSF